ncbi:MAG TPA: choice-of-anchor D domain-containing protein [Candidatus Aquilonibacter sp.]|nr:choice-of-anchor D domain-containing protein [Candidatus Aquilonibacter sp.]
MKLNTLAKMIVAVMMVGSLSLSAQQTGPAQVPNAQGIKNFGRLPLTFEANRGQTSGQVKFLSRGKGYTAFLTAGGMVLNLRTSRAEAASKSGNPLQPQQAASATLQFHLVGANQNPKVIGENLQPGRVNYFLGKDPSKWQTNLPTYGKVRYKNVYPGIDLVYYGNHQQLEYDFAVAPGSDPRQIQFEIKGTTDIALDDQGDLVLNVNGSKLHFQSPVVYQESNGQRVRVAGGYAMKDSSHIGFQVANYDSNKTLVIDPVLEYATYLGGSGTDQPAGIAVDNSGNVYVSGYTDSANFPLATLGALPTSTYHVFVAKLDSTGSNLVYADYIGGNSDDYGVALALDSANEVYVTGATQSSNFPVVNGYQSQQPGPYTGFLSKLSADGSALIYSTYLGGNNYDQPAGIGIDSLGEAYVAGYTESQNFPVANAYQPAALANQAGMYGVYGFLTKFSADGSSLVFSTYLEGNSNVEEDGCCWVPPYNGISALAVDGSGNAYVAGATDTYNFPVTTGSYLTTNSTPQNDNVSFVSKFNSAGGLDYSTYFYASSGYPVSVTAMAVDGTGSAYITGTAYSDPTFPVTSTSICDPGTQGFGCSFAFVTKFDPTGAKLLYSTFLGLNNQATPQSIALDENNDAYILSSSSSATFSEVNGIEAYDNDDDVLLVEIDPSGSSQLFATYLGGSGDDEPAGVAVDSNNNIYVAGSTDSVDLPTTSGAFQSLLAGTGNAFIAKIGAESAAAVSVNPGSLQFSALAVGSTSDAQTVLLRNMGTAALSVSSVTANGDFAQTNNCGSSVPAASSCTISVTFTPTAQGARSGSVVVQDDAAGAPSSIALSGVGEGGSSSNPAPDAVLTPSSMAFLSVPVGHSSSPQSVTLTNAGNASLTTSGIQMTGDFSETDNCPTTLSAGAACTINIVFTPTVEGNRSGSLTVSEKSSVQTASLTGVGSAASVQVSPAALTFASVQVSSSSSSTVQVSNTGNASVSITGLQTTGDYTATNNCPSLIAAGASCTVTIAFTPTATGTRTGSLTVLSGGQSAQTVNLTGTGAQADLVVSPTGLAFLSAPIGVSSASQEVTLSNTGNASLSISNVQIAGDYTEKNNCPASLAAGSSCTVNVVFTPTGTGSRSGSLTITDSLGNPQTVALSGNGANFSLTSSTSENTIQPGSSATYTLTASAVGGSFVDAVSLSCAGLPAHATCSFSPSTVTPGASKATTTLTISTTDQVADNAPASPARQKPINSLWMQFQGLGVVGMVLANGKKRSRKAAILILLVLLVLGMLFMSGCAGGTGIAPQNQQSSGTAHSYTVTVTGASGSLQQSIPLTLTIQ